jgi:glucose-6-phosphate 1-dehydrogenase
MENLNKEISKMQPFIFVIFGGTGDLCQRKLLPALYNLSEKKLLPESMAIVAVARKDKTHDEYRKDSESSVKKYVKRFKQDEWEKLAGRIYYFQNDFDTKGSYPEMKEFLTELDLKYKTQGNRVLYLATMPNHFKNIINNLKKYNCISGKEKRFFRIIVEKPFGDDLKSAAKLNSQLRILFSEDEIFRIDHYLGKETVQNLFALRFANKLFESVWDSKNIEQIQITAAESLGVENRGAYYDNYGALKDMVQNHLLQLLSIVAMEPPKSFLTDDIKKEKEKLLKKISVDEKNIVFGQYKKGASGVDYVDEPGVKKDSTTETYASLKVHVNNKRWLGVPFYLRTGKSLARKASEVVIYFKDPVHNIFDFPVKKDVLVVRLQPDEGIYLRFNAKEPGNDFRLQEVSMDFCHECLFGLNTPEAYEKLLFDAFSNDSSLFTRWDELKETWKIIDCIKKANKKIYYYKSGSWGPEESEKILEKDHKWREPL